MIQLARNTSSAETRIGSHNEVRLVILEPPTPENLRCCEGEPGYPRQAAAAIEVTPFGDRSEPPHLEVAVSRSLNRWNVECLATAMMGSFRSSKTLDSPRTGPGSSPGGSG